MDNSQTLRDFASDESSARADQRLVFADPWAEMDAGQERRENWMLSYIDILTLLLTLLVLLLALQPKHESPVSGGIPALAGLAALMPAEQLPSDVLRDYQLAAERSIALTETVDDGLDLAMAADLGIDAAIASVEPEIALQATLGTVTLLALESLILPQRPADAVLAEAAGDPVTPAAERPVKTVETHAIDPSTNHAQRPESGPFDTVLSALSENSLDSRLKVSQIAEGVHLEVNDKILFAEGSAQLRPEGQGLLTELAQVLLQHRGMISVEGHTDIRPISSSQFPSNWELSSGRATTVTRHLIDRGLDAARLRAVGYADTRPLETNATAEGRMRNRRVSLILAPAVAQ